MSEREALLISSGDGPGECRQAVGHLLHWLADEAAILGLDLDVAERAAAHGPASAVVVLAGIGATAFARNLEGVVLWRCPSRLRPKHPRKTWFVGVFRLPATQGGLVIPPDAVEMQAIRAGGPGGQHQNKTSSAIRARWQGPDGRLWSVVVRDTRSQHQNRRLALERLNALIEAERIEASARHRDAAWMLQGDVRAAAPRRVFAGADFRLLE